MIAVESYPGTGGIDQDAGKLGVSAQSRAQLRTGHGRGAVTASEGCDLDGVREHLNEAVAVGSAGFGDADLIRSLGLVYRDP